MLTSTAITTNTTTATANRNTSPIATPLKSRGNGHFLRTPNSSAKVFINPTMTTSSKRSSKKSNINYLQSSEYLQTTISIINSNSSLTATQKKILIEKVDFSYQNFMFDLQATVQKLKNDLPTNCQTMKINDFIRFSSTNTNTNSTNIKPPSTPNRRRGPQTPRTTKIAAPQTPKQVDEIYLLQTPGRITRSMTKNMTEQSRLSYQRQLDFLKEQISTPSRRPRQQHQHLSNTNTPLRTPKLHPKLPKTPQTTKSSGFTVRSSSIQLTPSRKRNENPLLSGHLNLELDDGSTIDVDLSESPQKLRERLLMSSKKKKRKMDDDGEGNDSRNSCNENNIKDMKEKMQAYASQLSSFFSRLKD